MKLLFLIPLLFSANCFAQCITGTVLCDNKPVEYAVVSIKNTDKSTTTDSTGKFKLCGAFAENSLEIMLLGYRKKTISLSKNSDNQNINLGKINVEQLENELKSVVISGTLQEITKEKSPVPIDIISAQAFKRNVSSNIFDALQQVNGVQPQINCNVCNTGDIHLNGMEGPYTLVTIDGMPIVSSLATVYGLMGIPNSIIDRVEVMKGAASSLYGSEAMAGIINIITKNPASAPLFSIDTYGTSQKEINLDISAKKTFKSTNSLLSANIFSFSNLLDVNNDNFTDIPVQQRFSLFNKWSFVNKNNLQSSLAWRAFYENRWGGELNWKKQFYGGDSVYGENVETKRFEIIGKNYLFNKTNFTLNYSYNYHKQASAYGQTIFNAEQNTAFLQFLYSKNYLKQTFLIGLPIKSVLYKDNTPTVLYTQYGLYRTTFVPGVFVQQQSDEKKRFVLLNSARLDYNTNHGFIFTPRSAVKFVLNEHNIFRLFAGSGYRNVSVFTEDHAALSGSRIVEIKNKLNPEKSWNGTLNHHYFNTFKSLNFSLENTLFYTHFLNKIIPDYTTDVNKIIYDNISGYSVSRGASSSVQLQHVSGNKINIGATYLDVFKNENNKTQKQVYTPELSINANASFVYKSFVLDYFLKTTSPMLLPVQANDYRLKESPWFSIHNLQLSYKSDKRFDVYVGVKNITNFLPENPIMRPHDPFDKKVNDVVDNPNSYSFDTDYNYAPLQGRRFYLGFRYSLF